MSLTSFLGTDSPSRLHGGHQALVFEAADESGRRCVAKLRDMAGVDRTTLNMRMEAIASLARVDPRVCSPLMRASEHVTDVQVEDTTMFGTLVEYAQGGRLNHDDAHDARVMGTELAKLHESLSTLPHFDLPLVPALSAANFDAAGEALQLLHGDFSDQNLRNHDGTIRIFDFDDCGYGPREFDVANSLYMVLFDDMTTANTAIYFQFENEFLDGYNSESDRAPLSADTLSSFVDLRVGALEAWLDDPGSAPAGIRTASPEWHRTLRQFVENYWARGE